MGDDGFAGGARTALNDLCDVMGVQPSYEAAGSVRVAPEEAVRHALRELGADLSGGREVTTVLREERLRRAARVVEPVTVAWSGAPAEIPVRVPAGRVRDPVELEMVDEEGREREYRVPADQVNWDDEARIEGGTWRGGRVPLPRVPPEGYHEVTVRVGDHSGRTRLIRAPRTTWDGPGEEGGRWPAWGTFLPLHALRTDRSLGLADFTDLAALARWTRDRGGSTVGTLPLLAAFLGGGSGGLADAEQPASERGGPPLEPSPYAPVSRLFWNEAYVDVERAPGLDDTPDARERLASDAFRHQAERLRAHDRVDWRAAMALKRSVLERLAASRAAGEVVEAFIRRRPEALDYARFRARVEEAGTSWRGWSGAAGGGTLGAADVDPERVRYHLFVQAAADRQVRELPARERLYLDLPLGCHPDGYDVWRHREHFALGASGGAPPDAFFAGGQDWGFPPLHPWRSRERGHAYLIACLRHLMDACSMLRLDHVMSLHRLFWVPAGGSPAEGVYVRYPHDELWAVLCLESRRHRVEIVGEDLGTVPPEVPAAMERHGARRMWVLPFEAVGAGDPPTRSVASLNTHDMPPFAAFWKGGDIRRRIEQGHLEPDEAEREADERRTWREALRRLLEERDLLDPARAPGEPASQPASDAAPDDPAPGPAPDDLAPVLAAALEAIAVSPARLVLVNLEDLWLEEAPQNEPGTSGPHNWTRRARLTLEQMQEDDRVVELLDRVDRARRTAMTQTTA